MQIEFYAKPLKMEDFLDWSKGIIHNHKTVNTAK